MSDLNKVLLIGRVTSNAKKSYKRKGSDLATGRVTLGVSTSRNQTETVHRCIVRDAKLVAACEGLPVGKLVYIEGWLEDDGSVAVGHLRFLASNAAAA